MKVSLFYRAGNMSYSARVNTEDVISDKISQTTGMSQPHCVPTEDTSFNPNCQELIIVCKQYQIEPYLKLIK